MRVQHLALKSRELAATGRFYHGLLGLEVAGLREQALIAFRLEDGFVLRFDFTEEAFTPAGLSYFGLELPSFADVDAWFERLKDRAPVVRDLRPNYTHRPGPYGFLLRDPDGYVVKLFKYGPRVDQQP